MPETKYHIVPYSETLMHALQKPYSDMAKERDTHYDSDDEELSMLEWVISKDKASGAAKAYAFLVRNDPADYAQWIDEPEEQSDGDPVGKLTDMLIKTCFGVDNYSDDELDEDLVSMMADSCAGIISITLPDTCVPEAKKEWDNGDVETWCEEFNKKIGEICNV